MDIDSHLNTCVDTQSPKYLEMAQGHISLSMIRSITKSLQQIASCVKFTTYYNFSVEEVFENNIKPQTIVVKNNVPSKN
jgi:hypothetical protein